MWEILIDWFGSRGWMPHGMCFMWTPSLLWTLVISNLLIAFAYYSIPLALLTLVRKRRDLVHKQIFILFALFIGACGTAHILHVVTIWEPLYWLQGLVDSATAGVSVLTAALLWPLLPRILTLPSPAQMVASNFALQQEVDQHKETQTALQQSEEQFRLLVEDNTSIMVLLNNEATVRYATPAYTQLLGGELHEITGQSYFEFVHPDDVPRLRALFAKIQLEPGQVERIEYRSRQKNGSERVFETLCRAQHNSQDNSLHKSQRAGIDEGRMILNLRDITERREAEAALRESEERFRLMVQGVQDHALFMLDPQGFVVNWNAGAERLKGYHAGEIIGQHIECFYVESEAKQGRPAHLLQIATEQGHLEAEGWRVRKDGSRFWANVIINAMRDERGKLRGFSKLTRDMTRHRHAEDQVRSERERLRALLRVAARLNRNLDLQEILYMICEEAANAVNVPVVTVSLYDEEQQQLRYAAGIGLPSDFIQRVQPLASSILEQYYEQYRDANAAPNDPVIVPNVQALPDLPNAELYAEIDLRTTVNIDMVREGHLIGRLNVGTVGVEREFTEEELNLLHGLATQAAQALTNARLYEQSHRRLERLRTLHAIDRAITTSQQLPATLAAVVSQIAEQLAVDAVAVLTFDAEERWLTYAAGAGFQSDAIRQLQVRLGEGYAGRAAQDRRTYYTLNQQQEQAQADVDPLAAENFVSHYSAPMVAHDKVVGVLELYHRSPLSPNAEWLAFLEGLALQAAIAIDHAILFMRTQQQAQQLQEIMNTVPEGILLLDNEQHVVVANPPAQGYLVQLNGSYTAGEMIQSLGLYPLSELLQPARRTESPEAITVANGRALFEVTAQPLQVDGALQGWVLLLRDVTEARRRLEVLQQQERLATVGQLAAGIAHDFNNILTPVLLYAEFETKQAPVGSRLQRNLEQMVQAATRARDLVARILAFGRKNSGQPPRLIALQPVIREVLALVRASLPATIGLEIELPDGVGLVSADPTEIHQIVMNLCTNAFRAMEDGGGILRLALEMVEVDEGMVAKQPSFHAGPYARLRVADTGHGMSPETLAHIFDPFFTTRGPGQGTGLGLAVVYGLVTRYGGTIEVESEIDQGTIFTIYLPIAGAGDPADPVSEEQPVTGAERILVVDNEASIVQGTAEALMGLQYTVLTSTSGSKALEILTDPSQQVDLLLTDLTMPEMTGLQLAKLARQLRPNLPVVLMSGYHEPVTALSSTGRAAGNIVATINKPFSANDLSRTLRQVLEKGVLEQRATGKSELDNATP